MADRERVASELAANDAFEREDGRYVVTTTAFDAAVRLGRDGDGAGGTPDVRLSVTVRVPTIDSVVAGETVAPVVRDGWFETFERRLEDVGGVTRGDVDLPTARHDEAAGEVVVETSLPADRPGAAEDAKAVVDYVEGTFVEGIIPGYTYREPAAGLVERARSAGER